MSERELTNTKLDDAALATLVSSPAARELTRLAIGCNLLTDRACEAIAASPYLDQLATLSLGDTLLKNDFGRAPGALIVLEHPVYAGFRAIISRWFPPPNQISVAGMRTLGEARLPALRELGLWALPIGGDGVIALARSRLFAQLRALDLRNVSIGAAGADELARAIDRGCALEAIDLDHAELPLRGLPIYARVYAHTTTHLHVDVPFDDASLLEALARFTALASLQIARPLAALRTLLAWPGFRALTSVGLRGDVPLAELLPHLDQVRELTLAGNHLSDRDLDTLLAWPRLGALEVLDLRDNALTLAGLARLADATADLPALRRLELYGNVTDWRYDEWRDWDGSPVGGGDFHVAPEVREVIARIPRRIAIYIHDPR